MYLFGDAAAILNSTVSNGYDYYGKRETARDRIHDKHCQRTIIRRFMCVGLWAGVTYLRYTVLMSPNKRSYKETMTSFSLGPNKDETAVHCCDPSFQVLVMLASRSNRLLRNISVAVFCLTNMGC